MLIKKCDVCKNEVPTLYEKMIATHTDTINNIQYIQQDKLHICQTCMKSINEAVLQCQLGWYEENVKEDNEEVNGDPNNDEPIDNPDGNDEQNSGPTGGTTGDDNTGNVGD